jgi:putative membrane protein
MTSCVIAAGLAQANEGDKDLPLPLDQKYVAKAIECTVAEVKFAETALETSENEEVKKLAQDIKDGHKGCLKKLMDEATRLKLGVVEGLSEEHRETKARLAKLKGAEFDRTYVRGVIERHEKLVECCESQIKDGKADQITTMCKADLPVVKEHLEAARKVQKELKD